MDEEFSGFMHECLRHVHIVTFSTGARQQGRRIGLNNSVTNTDAAKEARNQKQEA